ncbi:MAG: dihydrodipicolinate synthase family protein [Bryobacteraceae bacterium]
MTAKLEGVMVAALTPRRKDTAHIDLAAALDLVDYYAAQGVDGITLMGTTGEFMHFDTEDRARLAAMAVKRSRVPVLVNISHSTFDGALRLAEEALDAGAAGLMLLPPHYFRYSQDLLRDFYLQFAEQLPNDSKLFLYNIPFFLTEIRPETSLELLATGRFAGIKDSSGNWDAFLQFAELKKTTPFILFSGSEALYAKGKPLGWSGIISGIASCLPDLIIALDRAVDAQQDAKAELLSRRLAEFRAWFEPFPVPVAMREAALLRGLNVGPHATPLGPIASAKLEEYRAWLRNWLPQMERDCKS